MPDIAKWGLGVLAAAVMFGWGAHEYTTTALASKEELSVAKEAIKVAGTKVDFILDRQMASVYSELGFLERQPVKTQSDIDRIKYLREQIEEMKKVKAGK